MSFHAVVLGCGKVGAAMVRDLAADGVFAVTVADLHEENLAGVRGVPGVTCRCVDVSEADTLAAVVDGADVVVGALPSRLGFAALERIIEAGRPCCDISFMPEDALGLDAAAKARGVTAVVDAGVSPGLSNLCVGHACGQLETPERAAIYVGGLPAVRRWPFEYKAPFAPSDVIEEYTRPARLVRGGKPIELPALSEVERIDFAEVGTLEAFNTDGLRTLLRTMDVPEMVEKTLRYPGHAELMRVLREAGFFDTAEIEVGGRRVRPRDVTAALLFPRWAYGPGEREFTLMHVVVEGLKGGDRVRHTYHLFDGYDAATGTSSMARTTGFPCTILARMVARGRLAETGVVPLEVIGRREGMFERLVSELGERGVRLAHSVERM